MDRKYGSDFSTGSIPRHLVILSIPMLISSFIQISYNIINTIWVGHLVGEDAVGAIGVSFPISMVLIAFSIGLCLATTILVAQYYGAGDYKMLEKAVNTSFSIAIIISVIFSLAAIFACDWILTMMGTPAENMGMASSYLKITMAGFIFMYLGYLINSILRGVGDSLTPMFFMIAGVVINAVLDPFLIGGFGPFPRLGLNGAAYASVISQFIALLIGIVYLNGKGHALAFKIKKLMLDVHLTKMIFRIGLPTIIQQSLLSIGGMFVTSFVNSFGNTAINAFGAMLRIDQFAIMPAITLSMAVATITGQNIGAGKAQRVKDIYKWACFMNILITGTVSLCAIIFSRSILVMFGLGNDAEVMRIGIMYLRIVGSSYVFMALMFVSNGIINGAGHTLTTMVLSLMSQFIIRVPFSWILHKTSLGINGIWIAILLSSLVSMLVTHGYYFSGRWKKSTIVKRDFEVPVQEGNY